MTYGILSEVVETYFSNFVKSVCSVYNIFVQIIFEGQAIVYQATEVSE